MVGDEDDDGVVAQLEAFELRNHAAEVPVRPGDGREIGADDLLGLRLRRAAADEQVGVARADGGLGEARRDGGPCGKVRRQHDLFRVVQIEEALRRLRRAVGLGESAADEEGLVRVGGDLLQHLDGAVGNEVVSCALAVAVEHEDLIGVGGALVVAGKRRENPAGHGNLRPRDLHPGAQRSGMHGLHIAVEVRPCRGVVESGMEELAGAQRGVAGLAEEMRQRDPLRMLLDHRRVVAEDSGLARDVAREQRRPRGIAQRELAVVAVEAHAACAQRIDVGTMHVEAAVVAGKLGAHVVGHEEEHVERAFALGRGGCLAGRCGLRPGRVLGRILGCSGYRGSQRSSGCVGQKAAAGGGAGVVVVHCGRPLYGTPSLRRES